MIRRRRQKPVLIAMRGLPACGKTTWAMKWLQEAPGQRLRISRDDLRGMMLARDPRTGAPVYIKSVTEPMVAQLRDYFIWTALGEGWSVVCDETNLEMRKIKDLRRLARRRGARFEVHDMTDVPLKLCLGRNAMRPDATYVPAEWISDQYRKHIAPREASNA